MFGQVACTFHASTSGIGRAYPMLRPTSTCPYNSTTFAAFQQDDERAQDSDDCPSVLGKTACRRFEDPSPCRSDDPVRASHAPGTESRLGDAKSSFCRCYNSVHVATTSGKANSLVFATRLDGGRGTPVLCSHGASQEFSSEISVSPAREFDGCQAPVRLETDTGTTYGRDCSTTSRSYPDSSHLSSG